MRRIICKNGNDYLIFGESYSPFVLLEATGLYEVSAEVYQTENSMLDGSTYIGSNVKARNIVLTVSNKNLHGANRQRLYDVFKPKTLCTLIYEESDGSFNEKRSIDYYVESIVNDGVGNSNRTTTISLICPDSYFSDTSDTNVTMTGWDGLFTFPHAFRSEQFATKRKDKLMVINNASTSDFVGMEISIKAEGNALNPKVLNVTQDAYIKVGTSLKPLNMVYGDEVIISTLQNNKNVYFVHDGVKTIINEYVEEGSNYIQLLGGDNTIRYFADEGEDNLLVSIKFRQKYLGV